MNNFEFDENILYVVNNLISGFAMFDDKYLYCNTAAEKILGYSIKEMRNKHFLDIFKNSKDKNTILQLIEFEKTGDKLQNKPTIVKIESKNNRDVFLYLSLFSINYAGKKVNAINFIDITELLYLKSDLDKEQSVFEMLIDKIPTPVVIYKEKFIYVNSAMSDAFGYPKEIFYNMYINDVMEESEETISLLKSSIIKRIHGEKFNSRYILKGRKKDGTTIYGDIYTTTVYYGGGWAGLGIFTDVTTDILKEQSLIKEKEDYQKLSEIDGLTNTYNRRKLDAEINNIIFNHKKFNVVSSAIMFDIDNFKIINDNSGHLAGDSILKELVDLIKQNLRTTDLLTRYGGDEFIIICPASPVKHAVELSERLQRLLDNYTFISGNKITCSFGVTSTKEQDTKQSLQDRLDKCLYAAKKHGKNNIVSV